jgi:hypothetical protein
MNLEEAISQMIELGEKNPLKGAQRLEKEQGHEWIVQQLDSYAEDLIAELFRQRLGSRRRSAEIAIRPGDPMTSAIMKTQNFWVPGYGYKTAKDVTIEDLELRVQMYWRYIAGMKARADWCLEVVVLMKAEGAETLGKLKADLPVLPTREDDAVDPGDIRELGAG